VAHYSGCGISDQDLTKAALALLGIAKKHLYSGRDFEELVSAGMIGLAEAIKNYGPGSNNGLSAFAVKHVEGAIKRFLKKSYWTVAGERNDKHPRRGERGAIEHFGNVALNVEVDEDGEEIRGDIRPDVSINAEIASDGKHGDDEAGGGTFLDEHVDGSLETITGDRWSRLERHLSDRDRHILS
jgi:DNA-directed RNA polymerase specialized sigma subunit